MKDPNLRYQDAHATIQTLCRALAIHFYGGLALERKGRYAYANNDSAITQKSFEGAIQQYDTWGAYAKVEDIKSRYGLS